METKIALSLEGPDACRTAKQIAVMLINQQPEIVFELLQSGASLLSNVREALTRGLCSGVFQEHPANAVLKFETTFSLGPNAPKNLPTLPISASSSSSSAKGSKAKGGPGADEKWTLIGGMTYEEWFDEADNRSRMVSILKRQGWIFDPKIDFNMGLRLRRFTPGFGASDGSVEAFLPTYRGGPRWRVRFDNHDAAAVDSQELHALRRNLVDNVQPMASKPWTLLSKNSSSTVAIRSPDHAAPPPAPESLLPLASTAVECYVLAPDGSDSPLPLRRFDNVLTAAAQLRVKPSMAWNFCCTSASFYGDELFPRDPLQPPPQRTNSPSFVTGDVSFRFVPPSKAADPRRTRKLRQVDQAAILLLIDPKFTPPIRYRGETKFSRSGPVRGVECMCPTGTAPAGEDVVLQIFADQAEAAWALQLSSEGAAEISKAADEPGGGSAFGFRWRRASANPPSPDSRKQAVPLRLLQAMHASGKCAWSKELPPATMQDVRFLPLVLLEASSGRQLRVFPSVLEAAAAVQVRASDILDQLQPSSSAGAAGGGGKGAFTWRSSLAMSKDAWKECLSKAAQSMALPLLLRCKDDATIRARWARGPSSSFAPDQIEDCTAAWRLKEQTDAEQLAEVHQRHVSFCRSSVPAHVAVQAVTPPPPPRPDNAALASSKEAQAADAQTAAGASGFASIFAAANLAAMRRAGWIFSHSEQDVDGANFIGTRVRRFLPDVGACDGTVTAYLPLLTSSKVDEPLYHVVYDLPLEEGGEASEDVSYNFLCAALDFYSKGLTENPDSSEGDEDTDEDEPEELKPKKRGRPPRAATNGRKTVGGRGTKQSRPLSSSSSADPRKHTDEHQVGAKRKNQSSGSSDGNKKSRKDKRPIRVIEVGPNHQVGLIPFDRDAVSMDVDFDWYRYLEVFSSCQWDAQLIASPTQEEQYMEFLSAAQLVLFPIGTIFSVMIDPSEAFCVVDDMQLEKDKDLDGIDKPVAVAQGDRRATLKERMLFACAVSAVDEATRTIVADCGTRLVCVSLDRCVSFVQEDDISQAWRFYDGAVEQRLLALASVKDYARMARDRQWSSHEVNLYFAARGMSQQPDDMACLHRHLTTAIKQRSDAALRHATLASSSSGSGGDGSSQGLANEDGVRDLRALSHFHNLFFPFKITTSTSRARKRRLIKVFEVSTAILEDRCMVDEDKWPSVAEVRAKMEEDDAGIGGGDEDEAEEADA